MLSAVIIDDEESAIQLLIEMLTEISSARVKIAGTALNLKAGVEIIKMSQPDVVFLDISTTGKNGLEIYNEFRSPDFKIIFTSTHPEYAFDVLKKKACGYLLKPIDIKELENAVHRVEHEIFQQQQQLLLEDKISFLSSPIVNGDNILLEIANGFIISNSRNIEYCYSKNSNSVVVMQTQKEYEVTKSLKELEEILPPAQFYRTHKSFLVNIYYIRKFVHSKENYVVMESGVKVPVSVRVTTVISKDIKKKMLVKEPLSV